MTLAEFNALPSSKAEAALLDCCGATRWTKQLAAQRPFDGAEALCAAADAAWQTMDRADILEAFSHHPQIGRKAASGSESHRRWSEGEQTGARAADEDVKARLARGNLAYFQKFGYIFIVCATGKTAEEMLALLDQRLQNDAARELPIAAEQQRLIMQLRITKLFAGEKAAS
ncbi:MAG: 2-oxo-4-hydroxy-4-carboxy-5-ureidoimidazoline decarboxylase [Acidobacteriia bacterium]|nr:2-oxo-4-hydroxy-4-carboxy-5-ureidoimidazoline decarboxylase [Terriglobia bacterium]